MKMLVMTTIALALAIGPACAQQKSISPLKLPDESQILQTIIDDAKAALQDAQTNQDPIAATCYQAINSVATARLAGAKATGGKLLYAFQKVRDVTRINTSPMGTQLIVGCAPLVQDAKLNMVTFFTNIGGSVLIKGLLVP